MQIQTSKEKWKTRINEWRNIMNANASIKHREQGVTEWFNEHEIDVNHLHILISRSQPAEHLYGRFWNLLDSALHQHHQIIK